MAIAPLSAGALRDRGLAPEVAFQTTEDLDDLDEPLGQARAVEALALAVAIRGEGANVFVTGPPGAGKRALVRRRLERAALDASTPSDWCYLNGFADPRRPSAVELPPGRAVALRADLDRLVDELRLALPAAFESPHHRARLQALEKELEEARERAVDEVRRHAEARSVALARTPVGYGFAPVRDGAVVEPDGFRQLPEAEQERFKRDIERLQDELQAVLRGMPALERRHRERVRAANREAALAAAGGLLEDVRRRWADLPAVLDHLAAVERDVVDNVQEFLAGAEGDGDVPSQVRKLLSETPALRRYGANVMVDRSGQAGAPVVFEDLPSVANLAGRVEHHAHFGTLVTDFTLIRPGALHRANGGWLILDARRLLAQPFAWDELKRALRSREIRIEPPERLLGLGGTSTLEPQPIPLEVKVVLIGDRLLHHLLGLYDPEFSQLFRIQADFEDEIARSAEADLGFARLVATAARRGGLRPLDRPAVERVLRESCRRAGDATRISADVSSLEDLLREADHLAAADGRPAVGSADVERAARARERRSGRIRERLLEEVLRGTLRIETAGGRVGQVNGLSVASSGGVAFGRPTRISARVRLGRGEVVDIEREVELGGPLHSKGVLILAGYLGGRYCRGRPLTLAATLVMEQTYGGVEGDSASSAELYALLSAIAGAPLRQSLAVTGSVDQLGRVQAVGGVTEKVEGFFEVCRARGLTGEQGVLVPAANVPHLVLREEVLAAVAEERFAIFPVETVEQGMELLTGLPSGAPDAQGRFPEGTLEARVAASLDALAERARAFAASSREEERRP